MLESLTKEIFSEHLNTKFRLYTDPSNSVEAELVEVSEGRSTPRQEQFSLLFCAPQDILPIQRIYKIEHDKMGEFELFLVPVRKDQKGLYFEAIFNRLRKQSEQ